MLATQEKMILDLMDRTRLSEQEKKILGVTTRIGMKDDEVHIVFSNLEECGEKKEENTEKLLKYILAKGAYVVPHDILEKCRQICSPREWCYPNIYVKPISDAADGLDGDTCYPVRISYDNDRGFLIGNERGEEVEYPAELFQIMDVSKVRYLGGDAKHWISKIEEGLVAGEVYQINEFDGVWYRLENGLTCFALHAQAAEFVPAKPKQPSRLRRHDDALHCLRYAMEFGRTAWLENNLTPSCTYVSQYENAEHNGVACVIAHMKKVAWEQLEQNIFLDCAFATVTKSAPENRFEAGEPCLVVYIEGKVAALAFVSIEEGHIDGIYILTEEYEFELY